MGFCVLEPGSRDRAAADEATAAQPYKPHAPRCKVTEAGLPDPTRDMPIPRGTALRGAQLSASFPGCSQTSRQVRVYIGVISA